MRTKNENLFEENSQWREMGANTNRTQQSPSWLKVNELRDLFAYRGGYIFLLLHHQKCWQDKYKPLWIGDCSHECLISYVWVGNFFLLCHGWCLTLMKYSCRLCPAHFVAPHFNECWFRNVSIELITHYSIVVYSVCPLARKNDTLINVCCCSATYIAYQVYTHASEESIVT